MMTKASQTTTGSRGICIPNPMIRPVDANRSMDRPTDDRLDRNQWQNRSVDAIIESNQEPIGSKMVTGVN
jgi:hypothetical protein